MNIRVSNESEIVLKPRAQWNVVEEVIETEKGSEEFRHTGKH